MDYIEPLESDSECNDTRESTKPGKRVSDPISESVLTSDSQLIEFRKYFQLTESAWGYFYMRLHRIVRDASSWENLVHDDAMIAEIAKKFLNQNGLKFWGNPWSSYTDKAFIDSGRVLRYPDDGYEMNLNVMNMLRGRAIHYQRQRLASKENCSSRVQSVKTGDVEPGVTRDQIQSTFFIVCEEYGLIDRVCVPFTFYNSANHFIHKMEEHCGISDNAEVDMQIHAEMPALKSRYATVYLTWSEIHFVIRPDSASDWKALTDRLECAWRGQNSGQLNVNEFEIQVILKMKAE